MTGEQASRIILGAVLNSGIQMSQHCRLVAKCSIEQGERKCGQCAYANVIVDYHTDPSAWNDELYQWIEGDYDLAFMRHLIAQIQPEDLDPMEQWPHDEAIFYTLWKATPLQKAIALAQAIERREV
jgi:hypothetical protein